MQTDQVRRRMFEVIDENSSVDDSAVKVQQLHNLQELRKIQSSAEVLLAKRILQEAVSAAELALHSLHERVDCVQRERAEKLRTHTDRQISVQRLLRWREEESNLLHSVQECRADAGLRQREVQQAEVVLDDATRKMRRQELLSEKYLTLIEEIRKYD